MVLHIRLFSSNIKSRMSRIPALFYRVSNIFSDFFFLQIIAKVKCYAVTRIEFSEKNASVKQCWKLYSRHCIGKMKFFVKSKFSLVTGSVVMNEKGKTTLKLYSTFCKSTLENVSTRRTFLLLTKFGEQVVHDKYGRNKTAKRSQNYCNLLML